MIIFTDFTQKDKVMTMDQENILTPHLQGMYKNVNYAYTTIHAFGCLKLKILKGTNLWRWRGVLVHW